MGQKKNELTVVNQNQNQNVSVFSDIPTFEGAQRIATMLCSSDIVPANFRGKNNISNAMIALEMAYRIGASPLAVMQSLYIIHGKPVWASQFVIAALNSCGKFSPLRFDFSGEGDKKKCVAWAFDQQGERLEGPEVSIEMAKREGWFSKAGSKWKTMPDLMLRYRAAAFFGRVYAPDILMGMRPQDELEDIETSKLSGKRSDVVEAEVVESVAVENGKEHAKEAF